MYKVIVEKDNIKYVDIDLDNPNSVLDLIKKHKYLDDIQEFTLSIKKNKPKLKIVK